MTKSIATTPKDTILTDALKCDLDTQYFNKEVLTEFSFRKYAVPTVAISSLLSACGGGNEFNELLNDFNNPQLVLEPEDDIDAARFLQHASFDSSIEDIATLRDIGYEAWINQQYEMDINANAYENSSDDDRYIYSPIKELRYIWSEMITGDDHLRLRMTYALSQIMVVSTDNSGIDVWPGKSIAHYWDILKRHALGNYRELLEEITLSIPMGAYLSMKGNQKADDTGRSPDENYAREIMELFSIGLVELNIDGTPALNEFGEPIATYDQDTISNLARVFTGWDTDRSVDWIDAISQPMIHNADRHSPEEKIFLGTTIPADTLGPESLEIALDTIFNHPNVGPFIATQLIQRFVTSNPSPSYVRRVASIFNDNGQGERGDLYAVIRAVLLDDEARSKPDSNSISNGRVREPVMMQIQWLKFSDSISHTGTFESQDAGFTQRPCRAPSVFNFYRPDYATTRLAQKNPEIHAPELQLFNESTIAQHANMFEEATERGMRNLSNLDGGSDAIPSYASLIEIADNIDELINYANLVFCAGNLTEETKTDLYDLLNLTIGETNYSQTDEDLFLHRSRMLCLALKLHPEYMVMK